MIMKLVLEGPLLGRFTQLKLVSVRPQQLVTLRDYLAHAFEVRRVLWLHGVAKCVDVIEQLPELLGNCIYL